MPNKKFLEDLADGFQKLADGQYNTQTVERISDISYKIKSMSELKRKHGVQDLYFYKDQYGNYLCLTAAEHLQAMSLPGASDFLIQDSYDLEPILNGNYSHAIECLHTGQTYYSIESLKHDLLALELAGVE